MDVNISKNALRSPFLPASIFSFFVLALLITSCGGSGGESPASTTQKESVPDSIFYEQGLQNAVFQDLSGQPVSMETFRGKVVLVDFWETWCRPCLQSFPNLANLMNTYPDDFVVLAVNLGESDDDAAITQFRDNNPDYPFVWLKSNGVAQDVNVLALPFKVFLNPSGAYISHETGLTGSEEANFTKIEAIILSHRR